MTPTERYQAYIACLNARTVDRLGEFVADDVVYNGSSIGLGKYRDMLLGNYEDIPDLVFHVEILVVEDAMVAARLRFDCHPKAAFEGIRIDGRRVIFHENVFYRLFRRKISEVWSVIDKAEIEKRLG